MRVGRIGLVGFRLMLGREFTDMMTLTGAVEDQKPARQRETGSAKKKSHNATDSKRRSLEGARRNLFVKRPSRAKPREPWKIVRHATGFLNFARND